MEYDKVHKVIYTDRILNELDKFTVDFIKILEKHTKYVIVSGYVSILLGRSRASEDVDLLVPPMEINNFKHMFEDLTNSGFECANTSIAREAFEMLDHHAIRFYSAGIPVPNMEFKKITNDIQREALDGRVKVKLKRLNDSILFISPLELQIAYKLTLVYQGDFEEISSDKNFEDAKHIYEYFKDKLNKSLIEHYVALFNMQELWKWLQK